MAEEGIEQVLGLLGPPRKGGKIWKRSRVLTRDVKTGASGRVGRGVRRWGVRYPRESKRKLHRTSLGDKKERSLEYRCYRTPTKSLFLGRGAGKVTDAFARFLRFGLRSNYCRIKRGKKLETSKEKIQS